MKNKIITVVLLCLVWVQANSCYAKCPKQSCSAIAAKKLDTSRVDSILEKLSQKTKSLKSYQAQIVYLFRQPALFDSQTLRKGILYYDNAGKNSKLRLNFTTIKYDDEKEQKQSEQYFFDGMWLAHIDYPNKHIQQRQIAEPNEAVDAFELVSRNFPIVGFTKVEDLKKEFEIELIPQVQTEPSSLIQLHLKVKPTSIYKDDYTTIDFWIDKQLYLPAKIVATSTEGDVYQIDFVKPKVNRKIDKKIFDLKIPKGFGEPEIIPLKKSKQKI